MLGWLAGWYNWIFLLSFLVGMGLVAVTLLGFGKSTDGGDGHLDVDKHLELDTHAGSDAHPTGPLQGLAWLGVGKAPLVVLLEVFLVGFGLLGLLGNALVRDLVGTGEAFVFPVSLGVATIGAALATRGAAGIFERLAPPDAIARRRSGTFVGSVGIAASLVTPAIGQISVDPTDPTQPLALLNACVDPDWGRDISRGTEVLLVGYDASRGLYRVRPNPTE